ncbi:RNA polymerase sigma factor [Parachryseolinea silvisoli]|uniref:RNA polymerase sigma factor n=1 Tax=Parachryseolinea silvisoli TaxID=2873601 RepID=UPI0022658836|nr:sigma-70 family RNA polymerase sigma factor [Parachryseolinea silvisoli]MCD9015244.1 sigma-70 family RNA polymerase sigma factor [Parachryseolinea silvisoli]
METDFELVERLCRDDNAAFTTIYSRYFARMLKYVYRRLPERAAAKDIVQEIFVSIWTRRYRLEIDAPLEAYLYGACKLKLMTHSRAVAIRQRYALELIKYAVKHANNVQTATNIHDMELVIELTIRTLPPKCQAIFRLSRHDYLTIKEIGERMTISTRAVENYLSQALRALRLTLKPPDWLND